MRTKFRKNFDRIVNYHGVLDPSLKKKFKNELAVKIRVVLGETILEIILAQDAQLIEDEHVYELN